MIDASKQVQIKIVGAETTLKSIEKIVSAISKIPNQKNIFLSTKGSLDGIENIKKTIEKIPKTKNVDFNFNVPNGLIEKTKDIIKNIPEKKTISISALLNSKGFDSFKKFLENTPAKKIVTIATIAPTYYLEKFKTLLDKIQAKKIIDITMNAPSAALGKIKALIDKIPVKKTIDFVVGKSLSAVEKIKTIVDKIPTKKVLSFSMFGNTTALEKIQNLLSKIPSKKKTDVSVGGADRASSEIRKLNAASESAKSGISSLSSFAVARFAIIGDIAVSTFRRMGDATVGAVKTAWDYATVMQKSSVAWEKLAGTDAPSIIDMIKKSFVTLPYPIDEVSNSLMMMYTSGVKLKDLPKTFQAISDTAAASTAPDALNRITRGLTQMIAKQRVTSEEMMQLNEAGVNGWDLLANAIGVSTAEIREMSADGKLGLKEVNILVEQLGKRYEGLAKQQAEMTLSGQWGLLKNEITQGLGPAFLKLQTALVPVVKYIRTNVAPSIISIGGKFAGMVDTVVQNAPKIIDPLKKILGPIKTVGDIIGDKIKEIKDKLFGIFFTPNIDFTSVEVAGDKAKNAFSGAEEKVKGFYLDLEKVKTTATAALGVLAGFATFKVANSIPTLISSLGGLSGIMGSFSTAAASIGTLLNPVTLITAAVAVLIGMFVGFNIDKIMADAKMSLDSFLRGFDVEGIKVAWEGLKESFMGFMNEVGAKARWVYDNFVKPVVDFIQPILSFIGWLMSKIIEKIMEIWAGLMKNKFVLDLLMGIFIVIAVVIGVVIAAVIAVVVAVMAIVYAALWLLDIILKFIDFWWTLLSGALMAVFNLLKDLFTNPQEALSNFGKNMSGVVDEGKKKFGEMVKAIIKPFEDAFNWIKDHWPKPPEWLSKIMDGVGGWWNQVTNPGGNIPSPVELITGTYTSSKPIGAAQGTTMITTNNYYTTNYTNNINGGVSSIKEERALSQRLAYLGKR